MKIRIGFVSNSSSSSFCIFGAVVPSEDDERDLPDGLDYEYGVSDYYDQTLVGSSPWSMGINETRGEFEKRITDQIIAEFGSDIKCGWHKDGGYNG